MRAFVTGGTSNLGKSICVELKENGFEVFASFANNEIKAQEIGEKYGITFYHIDVCDEDEVKEVFSLLPQLDLLVNNSGVCSVATQENLSLKAFNSILKINTTGVFLCSKYAIPKITKGGSIINITSVNAINPMSMGTAHYDGTKGFINSYTKSLALELGERNIRVNAVAPGLLNARSENENKNPVRDRFINRSVLKRTVDPREIAETILFLSSNKAITGEIINVDCGFLIG